MRWPLATLVAVVASSGCGKLLGVDEYRVRGPSGNKGGQNSVEPSDAASREASTDGAEDARPSYFSKDFQVMFASTECGKCSDANCLAEEINCGLKDADCYAWARCRALCRDAR